MLDINSLLRPVSEELPCGDSLRGTVDFLDLEAAKQGEPDRQFYTEENERSGTDWKDVKAQALALHKQTRDLQVLTYLVMAELHVSGMNGFCQGIRLIKQSLETFWDCMYPPLDDEDPDEPAFERSNILYELGHISFLVALRKHPLISARMLGAYSLNQIQAAYSSGDKPADTPKPELIDGVFTEMGADNLSALYAAVIDCLDDINAIQSIFKEKASPTNFPDLDPLAACIKEIRYILQQKVSGEIIQQAHDDDARSMDEKSDNHSKNRSSNNKFNAGDITSRQEVEQAIDKIHAYYKKYEPGSPIPLLLTRAKNMVHKDFIQIIEELSPDSLNQIRFILGASEE